MTLAQFVFLLIVSALVPLTSTGPCEAQAKASPWPLTPAHETTHAVVARIYRRQRWPVWLGEGFAEYVGDAGVAARRWQSLRSRQHHLRSPKMPVAGLLAIERYPVEVEAVTELYETSFKFVRYLFNKYPRELFPKFVERVLGGELAKDPLVEVYGDEFRDLNEYGKRFRGFFR